MKNFRKFIMKVLDNMSVAFFGMVMFAFTEFLFGIFGNMHLVEIVVGIPITIAVALLLIGLIGIIVVIASKHDELK